jgi:hypothetical protein
MNAGNCQVVTDGAAGNENQAVALARALGSEPAVVRVRLRLPWRWLAPSGPRDPRNALPAAERSRFSPPWPDLVIGCGRAAALVTRRLRRLSEGRTRVVQILDPRRHRDDFDALVVPEHDGLGGANVVSCLGALNGIDDDWLARGRARFAEFVELPAPRTAVLIGGPVRGFDFDRRYLETLQTCLARWHHRDGGSFLVTCSRRTPHPVVAELRAFFSDYPGIFHETGGETANPYAGILGWAERIVVTPDSSNLLSEACATGVPVLAALPKQLPNKQRILVDALIASDRLHPLTAHYQSWSYAPLRELGRVAAELRERLSLTSSGIHRST